MNEIMLKIKFSTECSLAIVEGPRGEILFCDDLRPVFPDLQFAGTKTFLEVRDAVLDNNYHINHPEKFKLMKEFPASQGVLEVGLPPLTGEQVAKNDLRRGIQVVTEEAMKAIKG